MKTLLVTMLVLASCATLSPSEKAFGVTYGACMKQKGLDALPGVGGEVFSDLTNATSKDAAVGQLVALAFKFGTDAVACAVTAWQSLPGKTAVVDGGMAAGGKNPFGQAAADAWLRSR